MLRSWKTAAFVRRVARRQIKHLVGVESRHGLPVESVVVLLRPSAHGPVMTGRVRIARPEHVPYLGFDHRIVRAWRQPVDAVLAGGLGTLPLAPLSDLGEVELPAVIRDMGDRIAREASPVLERTLWATYLLIGLRYSPEVAQMIESYSRALRESSIYQKIRAEGRAEEARRIPVRLGTRRLERPDVRTRAALAAIDDAERLERMAERVLDATSWADVLSTP